MSKDFYTAIKDRRSVYAISKESPVSDDRIQEVINYAIMHTPSAFNSQSARVIILFGENHDKLWDITKDTLRSIVPAENFAATEQKINSFRNGYGTVLFFEDTSIVESLQQQFELYKDKFPVWSLQSNGMLEYVVWNSLAIEGLGASLQHYDPLIDNEVKKQWNVPANWKLLAQMPFGKQTVAPDEKQFQPLDSRVKVFK
jgi:predicted oxidoreductase (fatty acid repression mutant protein)